MPVFNPLAFEQLTKFFIGGSYVNDIGFATGAEIAGYKVVGERAFPRARCPHNDGVVVAGTGKRIYRGDLAVSAG